MTDLFTQRTGSGVRPRPSATLAIHEKVTALRRAGRNIFHLGFGESRFPVQAKLKDALAGHADRAGYLPILGLPELREAVAASCFRDFNRVCHPDQVVIGPGSKMLMYAVQLALKGDLLLPTPSWVSYEPQAQLVNKEVHRLPTEEREGYLLQPGSLSEAVHRLRKAGRHPRLLLLNSPSNPTGVVYPAALLAELAAVARREHLVVLSDEIYALTQHDGRAPVSIASFYPEGTIVSTGLSKHLSLGGWRLGTLQLPTGRLGAGLRARIETIASETWSAVAAPIQYAALTAFADDAAVRDYRQWCARAHGVLVQFLRQQLVDAGVSCPRPGAAFYVFPNFEPFRDSLRRRGIDSSERLADRLLEEAAVATLPGSAFGLPAADLCLRMSSSCVFNNEVEAGTFLADLQAAPERAERLIIEQTCLPAACAKIRSFLAASV